MSDIGLHNLKMDECYVTVVGDTALTPKHISLELANTRQGTWPWCSDIAFDSRKEWFKFVKLVNRENKRIKQAPRDKDGFPIFDKEEA